MKAHPKAQFIRGLAAIQGRSLPAICRAARVHPSVFYRVIRGERTSARIDRAIAKELGITPTALRRLQ